ncbi:RHS repeat-associated core domain-containing protein, partial [bacterium]|nr:RHS repeat-associated core domain-containing protein [bacterium]
ETKELAVTTYQYDNNGNTISKTAPTETSTYSYDYQNRMTGANVTVNSVQTAIAYLYDTDGMRVRKTVNGNIANYLLDKNCEFSQVLEEHDGSGSLTTSYVHGLDLVSQNRGGNVSWYHYDGQHSTRQLSDASAQVTDTYNYDAFGLLLQRTGSTENDYMYTGEQYDPNVGFYYLRARYYNPEIGRFTTVDPWKGSIYDPASLHKYVYCNNDPVDYVDWSGNEYTYASMTTAMIIAQILAATFAALLIKVLSEWDRPADYHNQTKDIIALILASSTLAAILILFTPYGPMAVVIAAITYALFAGAMLNVFLYDYPGYLPSLVPEVAF